MSVSSPETRAAPSTPDGAALLADGDSEIALEVKGLVKEYPGTRALDGVDIQIRRGEIHALLGENGAGKTTLIRSICGASRPTEGQIYIEGRPVELHSPQQAQDLGIAVVHQHFNLVPQLSVAENLFLSQTLPRRAGLFVNWSATEKRARKLLDRVGLRIDPWTEVSKLRPDESAMVAIAKAIGSDARIIILDEPTSALLPAEVSILFGHMRRLATEGHSFLYVSHRLAEVFEIADRVTVLRDGRRAGAWTREEMSRKTIIRAIVGGDKPWIDDTDAGRATHGEPVIVADALAGGRVRDLSFELRSGEILGFAGPARKRRRGGPRPSVRPVGRPQWPADSARKAVHASLSARRQERRHCARAKEPTHGKPALRRQRAREHLASEPQPFCHRSGRPFHPSRPGAG